ncbi:MAG: 4-hydroxy-3-methylbut-2-enyl diphosphate reductase [Gemmataceae bacterium]
MEVRLADHFGMCFGVRDAIKLALRLTRQGPVTILGDLVHNPQVVSELDAAGACRASEPERVATRAVLLTAHGTADRIKSQLREEGHQVHDAACPLVKRVHQALDKLIAEGRHPVVIGQPNHVEVRGLVGDLTDYTVVEKPEDLEKLAGRPRLGVVSQTTQPLDRVLDLVKALRCRFPETDIRFVDTVCQPTKDRQESMHRLAQECDTIVVVGGPDSNNSRKLSDLGRDLGRTCYQVAGPGDLKREWFITSKIVGLTAGTSTPDHVVQQVRAWLEVL